MSPCLPRIIDLSLWGRVSPLWEVGACGSKSMDNNDHWSRELWICCANSSQSRSISGGSAYKKKGRMLFSVARWLEQGKHNICKWTAGVSQSYAAILFCNSEEIGTWEFMEPMVGWPPCRHPVGSRSGPVRSPASSRSSWMWHRRMWHADGSHVDWSRLISAFFTNFVKLCLKMHEISTDPKPLWHWSPSIVLAGFEPEVSSNSMYFIDTHHVFNARQGRPKHHDWEFWDSSEATVRWLQKAVVVGSIEDLPLATRTLDHLAGTLAVPCVFRKGCCGGHSFQRIMGINKITKERY